MRQISFIEMRTCISLALIYFVLYLRNIVLSKMCILYCLVPLNSILFNLVCFDLILRDIPNSITPQIPSACYRPRSDCLYFLVPASAGGPPYSPSLFFLTRTTEPAKAGTCARDRRALQQLVLNVNVKHFDLT